MVEVELGQASAYSVKDGLGHGWLGAAFRLYSVNFIFLPINDTIWYGKYSNYYQFC